MTKGDRIKALRHEMNMSQVDLAAQVGVTKQTLYKYENDIVTNIPSDKIEALARVFGTSPANIMGWTDAARAPSPLTKPEQEHIRMYRAIDDDGRQLVDNLTDTLYRQRKKTGFLKSADAG